MAPHPPRRRRKRLDSANGRVAAAQLICDEFAGRPLGGFLFALAAAAPVFAMGGLWAAAGLVALALPVRRSPRPHADAPPARRSVYAEAREGIAWLARHRVVGVLALIGALASVGYMLPFSILVLFAGERLGLSGIGYGLLLAFSALGGLLGSFLAPRLRSWLGYRWTIVASLLLGALSLGGLAVMTYPILAGVLLALYILHAVVWSICALSLRQRLVPDALLGRVGGAARVLGLLGLAAGSALGGMLGAIDLTLPVAGGRWCSWDAACSRRSRCGANSRPAIAARSAFARWMPSRGRCSAGCLPDRLRTASCLGRPRAAHTARAGATPS
ncbi:MFS transporter [Microbacterium sp. zg.Y909]|uniref:MFS transporter n=1 Tax=Microbacterium sp. zg.Y909 TaxID=2969413 RepID=UPI00214CC1B4|nr:MFS transporter [Microbacterium sp. zg.Y909]MCR2824415.1 MFS transporter [Microbacterium sp. zg.Y909]